MTKPNADLSGTHAEYVAARTACAESKAAMGALLGELVGKNVASSGYPSTATIENPGTRKSPKPYLSSVLFRRRFAETGAEPKLYQLVDNEILGATPDGLTVASNKSGDGNHEYSNAIAYHFPIDSVVSIQEIPITES